MLNEKTKKHLEDLLKNLNALRECNEKALRREVWVASIMYVFILFWALWLKFNDFHMIVPNYQWLSKLTVKERFLYDIVPFQIRYDFANQFREILLNGIVFTPFGVMFSHLFKKKSIWRDLAICFGISLSIELVQLFTLIGSFATADLIMNTVGYFIGYAVYKWIFSKFSCKVMLWVYRVANLILLIALIVVIITTINNWSLIVAILTRTL